jgi:DNA-directed RNA polymerase specialized sigma24 family protein
VAGIRRSPLARLSRDAVPAGYRWRRGRPKDETWPSTNHLGDEDVAVEDGVDGSVKVVENHDWVEGILRLVRDPNRRKVVRLIYLEGATLEEAAEGLGISVKAVTRLRDQALDRIRLALGGRRPA